MFFFFTSDYSLAQTVREWKTVINAGFSGNEMRNIMASAKAKYVTLISNTSSNSDLDTNDFMATVCYFSSDSGKTFKSALRLKIIDFYSDSIKWISRNIQSVEMSSENLILLLGTKILKGDETSQRYPFIMRSTNMGYAWEEIEISENPIIYNANYLSMLDDNFGILISGRIPTSESESKTGFYKTFDGGKTWSEFDIFPISDYLTSKLKCFSEDNYVLISDAVYITTDGGKIWDKTQSLSKPGHYSLMSFDTWFFTGAQKDIGYVYKTTNRGKDWITINDAVTFTNGSPTIFKTNYYDENNALGITNPNNLLLRTTDGGLTWVEETTPHEVNHESYYSAQFFANERAISFMENRALLYLGNYSLKPPSIRLNKESDELLGSAISWYNIAGGEKFKLQVSETKVSGLPFYTIPDYENQLIVNEFDLTDTIFNLKFKFNKRYHARVKVYTNDIESDWSKMFFYQTPKDTAFYKPLDTVKIIQPNISKLWSRNEIKFIWNKVNNARFYNLYVCTPAGYKIGIIDYSIEQLQDTVYSFYNFSPKQQYLFWVIAEAEGWSESSSNIRTFLTEDLTSVDIFQTTTLRLFPNPAKDYIEIQPSEGSEIIIFNTLGEIVLTVEQTSPSVQRMDVSKLAPGMYFIKVGYRVEKFMKI
jgi:hypothetical protein